MINGLEFDYQRRARRDKFAYVERSRGARVTRRLRLGGRVALLRELT